MQNGDSVFVAIVLLISSLGAAPIPADKCIPAHVEKHLSIPPPQRPMTMPTDVAVDSHGTIFIADGVNDRVVRFSANGEMLPAFAPAMNQPVGLFVDRSDRLWIADSRNHRVLKLRDDGEIDEVIDLPNGLELQAKPTDIALDAGQTRLYVVDNANHRLLVRDQRSMKWIVLGDSGKSLGQFQYPFMIAVGAHGYVYVTETIGARVQAIAPTDRWAGQISGFGVELGQVYRPKGIAVDAGNRVFISDSTLQVIEVFSSLGALEGVLTDEHQQPLRFAHPMGMCFDAHGKLYVVELKANRVAVVTLGEPGGPKP
jgi:DNA-binding beta-propeller fold protein YncE